MNIIQVYICYDLQNSMIEQPPRYIENPGRSGAKLFLSYDRRVVVKSITSEMVALLHQILQPYHAVSFILCMHLFMKST